jgi:hypothetical protein
MFDQMDAALFAGIQWRVVTSDPSARGMAGRHCVKRTSNVLSGLASDTKLTYIIFFQNGEYIWKLREEPDFEPGVDNIFLFAS